MTTATATVPTTAPPRTRTASDVLLAAARYIEEHGWCQSQLQTADGRVCVVGSLYLVTTGFDERPDQTFFEPMERLARVVEEDIPTWNDRLGRTEQEVLAALRAAAREPQP